MKRPAVALVFLSIAGPAFAQIPGEAAIRTTVEDLVRTPGRFNEREVIVKGRLRSGDMQDQQNRIYELQDLDSTLSSVRVGSPYSSMNDLRFMEGARVEAVGVFLDLSLEDPDPRLQNPRLRYYPGAVRTDTAARMDQKYRYFLAATSVTMIEDEAPLVPEPKPDKPAPKAADLPPAVDVDLRELGKSPEGFAEKRVTVVGKFRGDNLYLDLPIRTKRAPRDFILKVSDVAIWVTGRRPRGDGFELDPKLRRDTGKWLKVSGVPRVEGGVVYLRADTIELATKPEDPDLEPRDVRKTEEVAPKIPPEVTFSLPLEGERGVSLSSEFRIQFSKDMNEASFDRNVDLLYSDDVGRGNPFPDLKIAYDRGSRTLVVSPGKPLDPGKEIRLVLYKNIVDMEGVPLAVSPESEADMADAAVILSFFTGAK